MAWVFIHQGQNLFFQTTDQGDAWETQRAFVFHDSLLPPIEFLSGLSKPYT